MAKMKLAVRVVCFAAMSAAVWMMGIAAVNGQSPQQPPAGASAAAKPADAVYKNIQVLKGTPADQVVPAMQFIANSLDVECEYCHVQNAFEKDDKKNKQTARQMMQMMFAINKDNFNGRREVTCYSCHHGSANPVAIPIIAEAETKPAPREGNIAGVEARPTISADQLLDGYIQAIGGAAALEKVTSRIEKGAVTFAPGHEFPVELFFKAPNKMTIATHLPNGESLTIYDGKNGWGVPPNHPAHEMEPADLEAARLDAALSFPAHLKQDFSGFRVARPEKVDDRDANVLFARVEGQPPVKLYFDQQSNLLVREVRYVDTPVGRNPTEIDFSDYRDVDGVKVPYRWTIARPRGRFTLQFQQVQQNVPIEEAKFSKPAAGEEPKAPPSQK